MSHRHIGLFFIAFVTLALEVSLTRLLSVITWYYLSFFAIAIGLLGATAGATTVYLQPNWFEEDRLDSHIAGACLGTALAIPLTLFVLTHTRFDSAVSVRMFGVLLSTTFVCALPFFFAGIAITATLTRTDLPIGSLYASDLSGAALGSLFVLGGLEILDVPSLILMLSAFAAGAGLIYAWAAGRRSVRRWGWSIPGFFLALALVNAYSPYGIRPEFMKGVPVSRSQVWLEQWNSYSLVTVYQSAIGPPALWGPSPATPQESVEQYKMQIDGDAGTTVRRFATEADIDHLRYDVTNVAYYVRPPGQALIIGAGGAKDVQAALLFGYDHVVALDINPTFIRLLEDDLLDFAAVGNRDDVELYVAEGRSFATHTQERFDIIQMSLIDTWAATGAGAFSLSENALYTVEAWDALFDRLADDGIFTVSRWYNPDNLGETGRSVSLAVATLIRNGVARPADHIALVTSGNISTLLISKSVFDDDEVRRLSEVADDLQFSAAILPGVEPDHLALSHILAARTVSQLDEAVANEPLNFAPPTDENPYFFNMMRLRYIGFALAQGTGVIRGNLIATATLILLILSLSLVTALTIVIPLRFRPSGTEGAPAVKPLWSAATYFSLIGAGFILVEIALIQRLSVFLSHPIYALGVLLFSMIASTGLGSYLTEKLPITQAPWVYAYPVCISVSILGLRFLLRVVLAALITYPTPIKIVISVALIFPIGLLLGLCYPTGMRLVQKLRAAETPWYWALNGIFSVLCSALAVFNSIYFGISINFYIAACCYLLLVVCVHRLHNMVVA